MVKKKDKVKKTASGQSKALARAMEMLEQEAKPAASRSLGALIAGTPAPTKAPASPSLGELIAGTQAPSPRPQSLNSITSATDIGRLIRAARKRMGLNQQEFADLAGVGRRFLSELEGGKPTLEFDKVLEVCAAAGIDLSASQRASQ